MRSIIVSQQELFFGSITDHKSICEIDLTELRDIIMYNYLHKNYKFKTNKEDIKVTHCQALTQFDMYIRDAINYNVYENFNISRKITQKDRFGGVMLPMQTSQNTERVDRLNYVDSPDYTCLLCVDVKPGSSKLIVEYDDMRRRGRTWNFPLESDAYFIFPSVCRYHISQNISDQMNIFFTTTYIQHKHKIR